MNNITVNTNSSQFALADKRHVNKYYYSADSKQWFLVLDYKLVGLISTWTLCLVSTFDGEQLGEMFTSQKDMEANKFSDRPFSVTSTETEFEWFCGIVKWYNTVSSATSVVPTLNGIAVANPNTLYAAYIDRRRYCCSFDALVRLGLRNSTSFINKVSKPAFNPSIPTKTSAWDKLQALFSS